MAARPCFEEVLSLFSEWHNAEEAGSQPAYGDAMLSEGSPALVDVFNL